MTRHQLSSAIFLRQTNSVRSPRTSSPTSMRQASGRQGRHRSHSAGAFWKPNRSIRTTRELPHGYTCHFPRPNWVLPHRSDRVTS